MIAANKTITEFLNKKNVFAVIGASKNSEKYGHKIYENLKHAGYVVYPVNPNSDNILGDKCYDKLNDLPIKPDVVNTVVPPKITENIVIECKKLGINKIWMQPGSDSKKAIRFCVQNRIRVLHDICLMIESKKLKK